MIKKIILGLILFFAIITITVLFFPLSFFQKTIEEKINSESPVKVEFVEKLSYRLINADELTIHKTKISYGPIVLILQKLHLNIDLQALLNKEIRIDDIDIDIAGVEWGEGEFPSKDKKENSKESEVKTDDAPNSKNKSEEYGNIHISALNFFVDSFKKGSVKLTKLLLKSSGLDYSRKNDSLTGSISFQTKDDLISGELKFTPAESSGTKIDIQAKVSQIKDLLEQLEIKKANLRGTLSAEANGEFGKRKSKENSLLIHSRIYSNDLVWKGKDLDAILDAYIDSKQVGLLETAGFLSMGPLGLIAAKGVDLGQGGLSSIVDGETKIQELNIETTLKDGVLKLKDVAVATKNNRVAAKGKILLNDNLKLQDFSVAALNKKDCPIFTQKVEGTAKKPDIGVLKTLAGDIWAPVGDMISKATSLFKSDCDKYYTGRVAQPK